MLYLLCLIVGGAVGCFVHAILLGSNEDAMEEEIAEKISREYYLAMLDCGLSPNTARKVEQKLKEKGGVS